MSEKCHNNKHNNSDNLLTFRRTYGDKKSYPTEHSEIICWLTPTFNLISVGK